jgi:hypothetical protein
VGGAAGALEVAADGEAGGEGFGGEDAAGARGTGAVPAGIAITDSWAVPQMDSSPSAVVR